MPRFQVHAIAHDHDAVEGRPRLGTVPGDELVNRVLVYWTRSWRTEAVKHGQFAMIQIWQAAHSAAVIRLDSLFVHSDGLLRRRIFDCGGSPTQHNIWSPISVWVLLATGAISRLA